MPSLFTGPQFVALSALNTPLPGAKLTFTQTGTSTPQNVYQDLALTVPHANPVVANGAGVFAKIYLDPSLPNYRVLLTDSSNVTQPGYPIDDYPSNQNTGQTFRLKSAAPELIFEETDAAANAKKLRLRVQASVFTIDLLNDAESTATSVLSLGRAGTALGDFDFLNSMLGSVSFLENSSGDFDVLSGTSLGVFRYKDREVSTLLAGTFTGTFTGFPSAVTQQVSYHVIGSPDGQATVVLTLAGFGATSNATTMTMTGIPASIANNLYGLMQPIIVTDNGAAAAGIATITTAAGNVITFGLGATVGNFTGSGTKGIAGEYIHLIYKIAT